MSSIVCFDIRNFSSHMDFLSGKNDNQSKLLANLIKDILNGFVDTIRQYEIDYKIESKAIINHTGDGFVSIFYGKQKSLLAMLVASKTREIVKKLINDYNDAFNSNFSNYQISNLGFGFGMHLGLVRKFNYKRLDDPPGKMNNIGLLGHAINLASRVEQTTKDHVYKSICTERIRKELLKTIKSKHRRKIRKCFIDIGKHIMKGLDKPIRLYYVRGHLHQTIKKHMIS